MEDHSAHDPRRAGRHAGRVLLPLRLDGGRRLPAPVLGSLGIQAAARAGRGPLDLGRRAAVRHPGGPGRQQRPLRARRQRGRAVPCWRRASATPWARPPRTWRTAPKPASSRSARSSPRARPTTATTGPPATSWWRGQPELQQGIRWNLFQLAQATACADVAGIPAKGVSGSGYDGHYFWDQEVYLLPYLTYTNPGNARQVLEFRHDLLPEAKIRAKELSVDGALFPWRTINGLEASAYYAAGTAQFHIAAAIAFATNRYIWASGDADVPGDPGLRAADRDRPDVGLPGLLRQGRTLPHPRRHRPGRVHRRRQRQPVHQRHGPVQPARRRGAGPPGDRRRRTPALGAGRQPDAAALRRGPPGALPGQRLHDPGAVGLDARPGPSTRCCCTSTRW